MLINPLSMCCQHDIMMEIVTVRNFVNVFSYDLVSHRSDENKRFSLYQYSVDT